MKLPIFRSSFNAVFEFEGLKFNSKEHPVEKFKKIEDLKKKVNLGKVRY